MAFNPFHQFRRHSKKMFAVLAIICMFTFVLSSGMGRGDWFDQFGSWVTGRAAANTVISVNGINFDARQADQVRLQRALASEYMERAVAASQKSLLDRAREGIEKLDPTTQQFVQRIVQTKILAAMVPSFAQQYLDVVRNAPAYDQFLASAIANAQKENKTDDVNTLVSVRAVLLQDYRQLGRRQGESYFGGRIRERDLDATADFLMWQKLADQLNIYLTQRDVQQSIADETLGGLTPEAAAQIVQYLKSRFAGYTNDSLYASLGDELRARMAQAAFLGIRGMGTRTRTDSPDIVTPEQQWQLFKDARTTIRAGLIALPVESFVKQVTAQPTDAELKKLYDQHKNDEPAPDLARPGFKEPRRIQVEWVSGNPESAFYQKAAAQVGPVFQALRLFSTANPIDAGLAPLELQAEQYDDLRQYQMREPTWGDSYGPRLHDTSIVRPDAVKSLVSGVMGAAATGGAILSGPLALEGTAIAHEVVDREKLGAAMIGFGASDPFAALGAAVTLTPQPLGLDVIRGSLGKKALDNLAATLLESDLKAFRAKVAELGKEKDKTALRKTVDEFILQRGMLRGATTQPRDVYHLGQDPGMAALRTVYDRSHHVDDPLGHRFGGEFFVDATVVGGSTTYNPQEFMPRRFDETASTKYVFWLTEDHDARVPRFEKAKPAVEEAWKLLQARELAKKEAERLEAATKQAQGDVAKLRDLAAQNGDREFFELGPMAKVMPVANVVAGAAKQYQPPSIPPEKIEFPSQETYTGLLDLRKHPRGATAVISDRPQNHYYVASLIFRDEPSQDEFRQAYVGSMAHAVERDPLLSELELESKLAFQRGIIEQLHAQLKVEVKADAGMRPAQSESEQPVE